MLLNGLNFLTVDFSSPIHLVHLTKLLILVSSTLPSQKNTSRPNWKHDITYFTQVWRKVTWNFTKLRKIMKVLIIYTAESYEGIFKHVCFDVFLKDIDLNWTDYILSPLHFPISHRWDSCRRCHNKRKQVATKPKLY